MSFQKYRLGDICLKIGSGATPRGGKDAYLDFGEYSLVRSQNILDFTFSKNGLAFINEEQASKLNNVTLEDGDILLNITGDSVARVCQIPKQFLPARVNQHVAIIRPNPEILNPEFLKYFLLNPRFKEYMLMLSSSGATRNAITKGMIEEFEVEVPDLPTQKAIAEILSSLDDKIELNNQINQNLEALAQALFKQWFVDFEFPNENGEPYKSSGGEMIDSELGEIPKGWEVTKIGNVSKIIDCLHSKKPEISKKETGYLYLQLNNIGHDGVLDLKEKYWISEIDYKKWTSRIEVKEGDFVITNVGRSGAVSRITKGINAAIGRNMTAIRLLEDFPYKSFFTFLLLSDFMKNEIVSKLDAGTILDALNVRSIPKLRFFFNSRYIDKIEMLLEPIWNKIEANKIENHSLIDLRDTLLPKLISGELEVNESLLEPTF
jgi:type I restriction enzyme S subunit